MPSNLIISVAAQNAAAAAVAALTDAGSGAGTWTIYDGTSIAKPASAITSQRALVVLTLPNPAYGAPVNGLVSVDVTLIEDQPALLTGTPTWVLERDSNGIAVKIWTAGVDGSGAAVIVKVSPFVIGVDVGVKTGPSFFMPSGA
jgi:hypothetical protein